MRDTLSYCIDRKLEFRENLTKSILALEKFDPLIAKYLGSQPVERCWKRLVLSLDSNFTTKVQIKGGFNYANSAYSPWSEARCQLSAIGALKEKDVLHYFGIGLGYHLLLLLQQNNALNLTLYEYDANWLIQAFSIHDFSGFFSSHSIKIFLNQVRDVSTPVSKSKNDIVWVNPVIGKAYDSYYSKILGSGVNIESGNQDVAVVIPLHSDPAYKNLSKKVSEELSRRNWTVEECGNGLHEIKVQCFKTRPKFLFSASFSPELSGISRNMKVPYVCWDVDKVMNCNFIRPDSLSKDTFVFTTYQEDVAKFQYAGANAYYLPPISNIKENTTGELKKEMPETFLNEISFVGSSLFYENNDFLLFERNVRDLMCRGNSEVEKEGRVLLSTLQRALDRQAPFTRRNEYKLREILVEELNGIYPLRFFTFNHQQLHNVLAKECCKMQRITYLKELSPFKVSLFGNSDWESVSGQNLIYKGVADYDVDSKKIYWTSKINIDITRIYQLDGFSDRVLNILSHGGFLMMNRTAMIEKLFEIDKELVVFDSPEELKRKCAHYLKSDAERKMIAKRGRTRAEKEHTIKERVTEIFSKLPAPLLHSDSVRA